MTVNTKRSRATDLLVSPAAPARRDHDPDHDPEPESAADPFAQLCEEIGAGGYRLTLFGRGTA